ncbi:hypothetical protein [Roseivirga thermotolerans]|uniref:Uncharacterized protein n=1 Tax=Roseivirga thermotolerans TaxID=1758176 RepID=A0ABQ3I5C9_9BACT|nr:hypothetical protein [Roseivirga thermotolerans]GHE52199.1 hypothetical protein GCM10011340_03040 [Roseivirga thermotolerans]
MKRLVLIAVFSCSLCFTNGWAQSKARVKEAKKEFKEYLQLIGESDWDAVMDRIYPQLFTVLPKEAMTSAFEAISSMGFKIQFDKMKAFEITHLGLEENGDRSTEVYFGTYKANIQVYFQQDMYSTEDFPTLKAVFAANPKYKSVEFVEKGRYFKIESESHLLSLYTNNRWYFLELDTKQLPLLKQLLSAPIYSTIEATLK